MHFKNAKFSHIFIILLCFIVTFNSFAATANATQEELNNEAEERKNEPVDTDDIEGWPDGPKLGAEGAILIDANTGTILYAKNINERLFPASTTKIMTSLVALENCNLDEVIHVNQSAIDANASDGSNMGLYAGEELTLDELLHGVLISSANEACNAIAEHIAGSLDGYVEMMNAKARELGLQNTHFVSTNGLHNEDHYTSAYDLAMIAKEFFSHDTLCEISSLYRYVISETASHREHYLSSHNKLLKGMEMEYQYIVGSKTGFTSNSRQTLVSCAEKDGMKLICVILREESPNQFADTIELFEYGFNNFKEVSISDNDKTYTIKNPDCFEYEEGFFGNTTGLVTMNQGDKVTIPADASFEDLHSTLSYTIDIKNADNAFATVSYDYNGQSVGSTTLLYTDSLLDKSSFYEEHEGAKIINIKTILKKIIFISLLIVILLFIFEFLRKLFINKKKMSKIKKSRHDIKSSGFSKRKKSYRPHSHSITLNKSNNRKRRK